MKFSINQSELQDALAVVLKGIATRSTLPILSGIYLDAHNDNLTLQATDLELSIQFTIPALVEEEGRSVFPGKLFFDIVKNLPDAAVHVETGEDSAVSPCNAVSGAPLRHYRVIPMVQLRSRIFRQTIQKFAGCSSTTDKDFCEV